MQQDLQLIEWKSFKQTASVDIPDKTWMDINEIKYTMPQYDVVKSLGFKIGETEDIITLASSIKNGLAHGITPILKQDIISQVLMGKQPKLDNTAYTKVIEDKIKSGNLTIGTTATITRPSNSGLGKKQEVSEKFNKYDYLNLPKELAHVDIDKFIEDYPKSFITKLVYEYNLKWSANVYDLLKILRKHKLIGDTICSKNVEGLLHGSFGSATPEEFIHAYRDDCISYDAMFWKFRLHSPEISEAAKQCEREGLFQMRGRGWKNPNKRK